MADPEAEASTLVQNIRNGPVDPANIERLFELIQTGGNGLTAINGIETLAANHPNDLTPFADDLTALSKNIHTYGYTPRNVAFLRSDLAEILGHLTETDTLPPETAITIGKHIATKPDDAHTGVNNRMENQTLRKLCEAFTAFATHGHHIPHDLLNTLTRINTNDITNAIALIDLLTAIATTDAATVPDAVDTLLTLADHDNTTIKTEAQIDLATLVHDNEVEPDDRIRKHTDGYTDAIKADEQSANNPDT